MNPLQVSPSEEHQRWNGLQISRREQAADIILVHYYLQDCEWSFPSLPHSNQGLSFISYLNQGYFISADIPSPPEFVTV